MGIVKGVAVGVLALGLLVPRLARAADIVIGVPNWPSVNATAHILKTIIEDDLGLKVELQDGTNPTIFAGMANGSVQIHPEVWLPNQQSLLDKYAALVVKNDHPAAAVQGLCVDKAAQDAGVKDISDLTDPTKAALFDLDGTGKGSVFIGAPGWASTSVERVKAKSYGYDQTMTLKEMDEGVAYAQLDAVEKANKPWVGFCYAPHHLFIIHPDLVRLKEPPYDPAKWHVLQPDQDPDWLNKSTADGAWPDAYLQPVYAKSLDTKYPQVAALIRNVDLSSGDISGFAFALVVKKQDPTAFASAWVAEHKDRVDAWLK